MCVIVIYSVILVRYHLTECLIATRQCDTDTRTANDNQTIMQVHNRRPSRFSPISSRVPAVHDTVLRKQLKTLIT